MSGSQGKKTIIKQAPAGPAPRRVPVPDFHNLGALVRVLICGNLLMLVTLLLRVPGFEDIPDYGLDMLARGELPVLAFGLLLYACGPWLERLAWRELAVALPSLALVLALFFQHLVLPPASGEGFVRGLLWALGAAGAVLAYFRWLQISQLPALGEAQLLALTARIRPHFFFNALNGVLGVIRSDPRRAETALESLAELFRDLMRDNRSLVPLSDELDLCNRYLELERLRLGDRLRVKWELDQAPLNAQIPPLMLQPLLENAVCHGIEPRDVPGRILVRIRGRGNQLEVRLSNPLPPPGARRGGGNGMALANIRERLTLFFDVEASLAAEEHDGEFRVRVRLPLRKEEREHGDNSAQRPDRR